MRMRTILFVPLLASCWSSKPVSEPTVVVGDVKVEIASVTLADDCGGGSAADASAAAPAELESKSTADVAEGEAACEQSAVQLQLSSTGQTKIAIKKIELLDDAQQPLGQMTAREPTLWNDAGTYSAWDETLVAGKPVQASYKLSAPPTGGRWNAAGKTFHVRVTLVVGDKERTVEKTTTMPAMIEPDVVT